ncbi:hypothetical protein RFI_26550 [Reticulomyxa filosa]|uniref:NACHT domain-containing protein n=1 Tax=Reticulomyxa filosa TaxID=46433 RepID=X6MCR2_RETFI|nr:hypothetical protein RFI_26550 [Reticulomyxa filosa]|eukprot:ETO10825.1 hypothetical protein RFI_26550 [Reticulomyxa filosa]
MIHEAITKKLKDYYKSQDKLVPLFDDPEQSIYTCYIRLILLDQKRFQQRKEQWTNTLDYSLICGTGKEKMEVQDIWNVKESDLEVHHISICGEAGSGKSVLTQRIAHLWANDQMWNNQFQWLLHIPFRKIVGIFENNKNKNENNIKDQWLKIMKELNIPQWNANDTNIVYSKNGLLILDGFDEIANELNKKPGIQQWLQYYYSMSLDFNHKIFKAMFMPIFKNISNRYNDYHNHAEMLIRKLDDNSHLKLLSHTPLYLRLFCYFTRQQIIKGQEEEKKEEVQTKSGLDELNNISISKLYEKLLECYMKWNWIKFNGTKDKSNEQDMFNLFKMEMDYLSHIAWEGLKCGQTIISCEIQQKVLNIIINKYPRKHISVMSQWSRIYSFGFLQGQESMNPSHPIDSIYFPHLTFQEWFSAYYLVNCLYQSNKTKEHQEVCSILMNQQIEPKYSVMIPFMAGILYNNIESGKDSSGSGLLYFWKSLYSSPPQLVPIHQMMLCIRYTKSSFLSSQLQDCHNTVIHSFKLWFISWFNFDKDKFAFYESNRIVSRPLDDVIEMYLPTLQYTLIHPDIHLCIISQLIKFKEWVLEIQSDSIFNEEIRDMLYLLSFLCISTETSDIVLQCFESLFSRLENTDFDHLYEIISMRLKEDQFDSIIKFLKTKLPKEKRFTRREVAYSFRAIAPKLNKRQVSDIFQFLVSGLNREKNDLLSYAEVLVEIAVKLDEKLNDVFKYLTKISIKIPDWPVFRTLLIKTYDGKLKEGVFEYLINGLDNEDRNFSAEVLKEISMKLKEEHLNITLQCLKRKFNSKNQDIASVFENIAIKLNKEQLPIFFQSLTDGLEDKCERVRYHCAKCLVKLLKKWNQVQLNNAFKCLMNRLNENTDRIYITSIKKILMQLNDKNLDIAFQYLIDRLDNSKKNVCNICANLLAAASTQWNQTQLNNTFKCLLNISNEDFHWTYTYSIEKILIQLKGEYLDSAFQCLIDRLYNNNRYIREMCVDLLAASIQWNKVQLNILFMNLMKVSKDKNKHVRYSCAKSIQKLLLQLNDEQINNKQMNNVFIYLINGFKDKNKNVQYSCAESLGKIANKLNRIQLNIAFQLMIKKLDDKNEDILVRISCAESLGRIAMKLSKTQLNDTLKCLMNGLNDESENGFVHKYCAYSIEKILMKLRKIDENTCISMSFKQLLETILTKFKKKQFNNTLMLLFNGLKDENESISFSYVKELEKFLLKLNGKQFSTAFDFLVNGLSDENTNAYHLRSDIVNITVLQLNQGQTDRALKYLLDGLNEDIYIYRLCTSALETLESKLNKRQLNKTIKGLLNALNHEDCDACYLYMTLLGKLVIKLNEEELYLCTKHCLQIFKENIGVDPILSRTSNNMWQRVIMDMLKRDIPGQSELIAFGLWTYNPCIQFNFNNNIDPNAFNRLLQCCKKQGIEWGFPTEWKWDVDDAIPYPCCNNFINTNKTKGSDMSRLKFVLEHHNIDINDVFNEYGYTPLLLAIHYKHWDVTRYCIEQGAWIDARGGAFDKVTLQTPVECIVKKIIKEKKNDKMCKWILKQRTIYPMKQIEYAIDYVKDKLIDEDGVSKKIDDTSYETLLVEGATFLLGENQKGLQEILMNKSLLYWGASRNVVLIKPENCKKQRFDKGWHPIPFLAVRIFLLFEMCVELKQKGTNKIKLPKNRTFGQVYEKGVRELQVQLTTYWDCLTTELFEEECPELIDDWVCNVIDRLMNLKPVSKNEFCEMSLVVGHEDHCIYLSLCKIFKFILVRIDNRWMETIPSNTHNIENENKLIQSYLIAYFQSNGSKINKNKEWLKDYIKNGIKLRKSKCKKSMKHLYCDNKKLSPPREGNLSLIVKEWPFRPIQIDAQNCYLRNHNIGYRIRVGDVLYKWFRDQECKSFVFSRSNYNKAIVVEK